MKVTFAYLLTIVLLVGFVFVVRIVRNFIPQPVEELPPTVVTVDKGKAEPVEEPRNDVLWPSPLPDVDVGPPSEEPAFNLVLPTENHLIFEDPPRFYMHTNLFINGENTRPWKAGKFGFVRNRRNTQIGPVYTRLHEGIDIRPVKRDDRNVPLDDVGAISEGTVVYVNSSSSASNYGKYIVVKHDWPDGSFYSLYAHLASTDVEVQQEVTVKDPLGRMGFTGDGLNLERAHLHLELTFLISERFKSDYSPGNGHGNFNGINLLGIDVGRFLQEYQANSCLTMREFLDKEEPYFSVVTASKNKPGILARHPWLGKQMDEESNARGWEFTFTRAGIPISIKPCKVTSKFPTVTWVKTVNTNHSYMTSGRLSGSGSKASLSSRGIRFINLISEAF